MNSNENQLMTTSRRFPGCFTNILLISMNTSGTFAFFQKLALHRGFDFALSTASVIQGDRTKDPHTRRTMTNCSQMTNWKMKITVSLRSLIKNQEWYVVMDKSDKQRNRVWTSMRWKTQNKRKTSQAFPPATAEGKGVNCHCIMNLVPGSCWHSYSKWFETNPSLWPVKSPQVTTSNAADTVGNQGI